MKGLEWSAGVVVLMAPSRLCVVPAAYSDVRAAYPCPKDRSAAAFQTSPVSTQWFDLEAPGLPKASVAFSPHADADLSLGPVADAIAAAKSSVLFAIMEIGTASGPVEKQLVHFTARARVGLAGDWNRSPWQAMAG